VARAELIIRCPQCGSEKTWRDGIRYSGFGQVQRYICRRCGYRFSDPEALREIQAKVQGIYRGGKVSAESKSSGMSEHVQRILTKSLKSIQDIPSTRQICVNQAKGAKNLAVAENQTQAAGVAPQQSADVKGKIVEFAWWLQKQGYSSAKNRVSMIKQLVSLGANLWDPESVKDILAKNNWTDGYKMLLMYTYESFLKMEGHSWQRPKYRQKKTLPFIPTEEELDQLIAGVGKTTGVFLQGLKDTGADPGELAKLRWIDINYEAKTVNITPVKGHKARVLRVSDEFLRRVGTLSRKSEYIFNYGSLRTAYNDTRKVIARKLNNPRLLKISFTTFRHWKGTMEYHLTHDIIHVKELLGHMRIDNTMVYINLEGAIFASKNNEFYSAVAKNIEDACKLIEAGFEYVTGEYNDGGKIFRKRK
jgi:integrase/transposase-like protein